MYLEKSDKVTVGCNLRDSIVKGLTWSYMSDMIGNFNQTSLSTGFNTTLVKGSLLFETWAEC